MKGSELAQLDPGNSLFLPVWPIAEKNLAGQTPNSKGKLPEDVRPNISTFPVNIPVYGNVIQRRVRARLRPPPFLFLFSEMQ